MCSLSHVGNPSIGASVVSWATPSTADVDHENKSQQSASRGLVKSIRNPRKRLINRRSSGETLARLEAELDEVENALIVWTGALQHQKTGSGRATARDEIIRLSTKSRDLWREIQELSGESPVDEIGESEGC